MRKSQLRHTSRDRVQKGHAGAYEVLEGLSTGLCRLCIAESTVEPTFKSGCDTSRYEDAAGGMQMKWKDALDKERQQLEEQLEQKWKVKETERAVEMDRWRVCQRNLQQRAKEVSHVNMFAHTSLFHLVNEVSREVPTGLFGDLREP